MSVFARDISKKSSIFENPDDPDFSFIPTISQNLECSESFRFEFLEFPASIDGQTRSALYFASNTSLTNSISKFNSRGLLGFGTLKIDRRKY